MAVTDGEGRRVLGWGPRGFVVGCGGRYEGEFRDDKIHGQGTHTWASGNR